jgi:hypothetical protein
MRFRSYLLVLAMLMPGARASAQEQPAPMLRDGMRVRVTAPSVMARRVGTIRSLDSSGFVLGGSRPDDATWVPHAGVQIVEVSAGKRRAPYVLLGFLLGPVAGVAAGIGVCSMNTYINDPCFAPIGFGLTGFIVGPVIGAMLAPERWRRMP